MEKKVVISVLIVGLLVIVALFVSYLSERPELSPPTRITFVSPTPLNNAVQNESTIPIKLEILTNDNNYRFINLNYDLLFWLRMEDAYASGNPLDDSSYVRTTGVWGSTQNVKPTQTSNGKFGKGYEFKGGGYIQFNGITSYLAGRSETGTISAWIKTDQVGSSSWVVAFGAPYLIGEQNEFLRLGIVEDELSASAGSGNSLKQWTLQTSNSNLQVSTWYHIVLVQDGVSPSLYINGVKPTQTFTDNLDTSFWFKDLTNIQTAVLGTFYRSNLSPTGYFDGIIDEVLIFDRALTSSEISALYGRTTQYETFNFQNLEPKTYQFQGNAVFPEGTKRSTPLTTVTISCVPNWMCGDWTSCNAATNRQDKFCQDLNLCDPQPQNNVISKSRECTLNDVDLCSSLSNEATTTIQSIEQNNEIIELREGGRVNIGERFVLPSTPFIFNLTNITNPGGWTDDIVTFKSDLSGSTYTLTPYQNGMGNVSIEGVTYTFSYTSTRIDLLDFPQTTGDNIGVFYDCNNPCPANTCILDACDSISHQQTRRCYNNDCQITTEFLNCSTSCAVWTQNTNCVGDINTTYYINTNLSSSCNPPKPAGMENITTYSDCDNNGIIGTISSIDSHNLISNDLEVDIEENELNLTSVYTGNRIITIKENGSKRVEFDWDFATPLNLREIEIRKQRTTDSYGYLIVNGIDVEKEIRVDRIKDTGKVCVKERHLTNINQISNNCRGDKEKLITCPGESFNGNIVCAVDGDFLVITGLTSSGATEFDDNYTAPLLCTESWSYSSWSSTCTNNQQTRIATDANNCGTITNRSALTQSCGTDSGTNSGNSGTDSGTDSGTNSGNSGTDTAEGSNTFLLTIIIIVSALFVIGLAVLIAVLRKKRAEKKYSKYPSVEIKK